jgi:phosphatidylglycerol:prolipoprotein diacylglycerol transferase
MYPHAPRLFGLDLGAWNAMFLVAVLAGYPLLRGALRLRHGGALPRLLPLRWAITVYVSALGAQLFAYLFDLNTSVLPQGAGWLRYYFDPLYGPKTLYGAILALPLGAVAITRPWGDLDYREALDAWTPPMFGVLALARVGCFLQGCCYGIVSEHFGMRFPPHGSLYYRQLSAGLIHADAPTLPVVPTQLLEAGALLALCIWAWRRLAAGRFDIFLTGVAIYSAVRFMLELLRDDPDRNFLGALATSQWIAVLVLLAIGVWRLATRPRSVPA